MLSQALGPPKSARLDVLDSRLIDRQRSRHTRGTSASDSVRRVSYDSGQLALCSCGPLPDLWQDENLKRCTRSAQDIQG